MGKIKMEDKSNDFLVDEAYSTIRDAIINVEYKPGIFITEIMLARRLGIGRTPIREALKRLEEHGYVRIVPRKGALVTDILIEDIIEIYQLREALECYAIQFVPKYGNPKLLAQIISDVKKSELWIKNSEIKKIDALDYSIHTFISKSSGNKLLVKIVDQLLNQVARLRKMTPKIPGRLEEQMEEHIQIITALKEGNVEEATKYLRNHLHNVRENAINIRIKML